MSDFCRNVRCVIVRSLVTLLTLGSCFHGPVGVGKANMQSRVEETDSFAIWERALFDDPTNDELAHKVFSHDTVFTNRFDRAVANWVGGDAKVIDYVKHTVSYKGRRFYVNDSWGGVMELPWSWLSTEGISSVHNFHGDSFVSPDSLATLDLPCGGFWADSFNSFKEFVEESIEHNQIKVESMDWAVSDDCLTIFTVRGYHKDGRHLIYKYCFYAADSMYMHAFLCWQPGAHDIEQMKEYIARFPYGPSRHRVTP